MVLAKEARDSICGEFIVYVCSGRVRRVYASGFDVGNEKYMGVVATDATHGIVHGENVEVCWVDRCVGGWETNVLEVFAIWFSWV